MKGPLAQASSFTVSRSIEAQQTYLIADLEGERDSFVRAFEIVPFEPSEEAVCAALDKMYALIENPPKPPRVVKVD